MNTDSSNPVSRAENRDSKQAAIFAPFTDECAKPGPRLGSHLSVAGGLENAFHEAVRLGCDCVQLFVKNQRQWRAKPLTPEQVERFRMAAEQTAIRPAVAHGSYLLNLASPCEAARRQSVEALTDEFDRCAALGIPYLVVHPGASLNADLPIALANVARSLNELYDERGGATTMVLLETTAGQGSSVGHRFEHLWEILEGVIQRERVGVCLDTCHLFAAGYDFRTPESYRDMIAQLDRAIGLALVKCIHLNDSKRELGSRIDRHEHIGKGKIGKEGFRHFVNDPRFRDVPMILETPKGKDGRGTDLDKVNLKRSRALIY